MLVCLQIVVGRSGTEMLTNEAGEVTRCLCHSLTLHFPFFFMTFIIINSDSVVFIFQSFARNVFSDN